MRNKLLRLLTSYICVFSLLINSLIPFLTVQVAYAEESTPSAEITIIPTPEPTVTLETTPSPTSTPDLTPTPIQSEPTPSASPSVATTPTQTPSQWTFEKVELNKEYVDPQNSGVKLTFTKLPSAAGNIKIEEITLTQEQIQQTGSLSDKAYDITSDMADGSFTYNLSLPIPESSKGKTVEVKFAEEISNINSATKVENSLTKTDTSISVAGLDHLTIFVITGTITNPGGGFVGIPFDESSASAVINEFVYKQSSGNEWVELFNKTGSDINLSNWTISDDDGHNRSLSGTLPANGIFIYENTGGDFLNNTDNNGEGDVIYLKNNGTTVDQVTYKKQANGTIINNTSEIADVSSNQSIGRNTDSGSNWQVFTTPSKGWFNDAGQPGKAPLWSTITSSFCNPVPGPCAVGIASNITSADNPSSVSGLYFEKTGLGKISLANTINMTDQAVVAKLSGLGSAMEMSDGHIEFDSTTASAMNAAGATLYMYGLSFPNGSTPNILVNGAPATDSDIGSTSYLDGTLSFTAKHFTEFDIDNNVYVNVSNVGTENGSSAHPYNTIQEGINAATIGGTINIIAGTYNENPTVNKALTLKGVGVTTIINGAIESTGDVVTIQDLKVTNSNPDGSIGYGIKATAGKTLSLENVTIDVLHDGVYMKSVDFTNTTTININDSDIKGYSAIELADPSSIYNDNNAVINVNVSNTDLTGTTSYGGAENDYQTIGIDFTNNVHIVFSGTNSVKNEFTNGATSRERLVWFYYANNSSITGAPIYTNAANSTVNDDALFMSANDDKNTVEDQIVARYVTDSTEFEDALASSATTPIVIGSDYGAFGTTKNNTLNAGTTLRIEANSPLTINNGHTLTNNGKIQIEPGATLITTGTIDGVGTIELCVNTGGTVGCFSSIQTAINAAPSGAIINVAAGIYDEQVVIDGKNLTLLGEGDTTIIRPSASTILTSTYTFPTGNFWAGTTTATTVLVKNASAVTLKDFKVDGVSVNSLPLTGSPDRLVGVLFGKSSGTIDNVTVDNIKTTGYANRTYGIQASGASTGTYSVEAKNSHVNNWARNGIVADGLNLTANINHNTLVGPGTISGQVANGILFIGGATGNATFNTISGMHYNASSSRTAGVLVYGSNTGGVLIDQNDIFDTDDGIDLSASSHNATVSDNNLHNNLEVGIQLEDGTANNSITENTIVNNTMAGIRFGGANDPIPAEADTPPGAGNVAHNNTITGNGKEVVNYDTGLKQIFNATNNWWGSSDPTVIQTGISGSVTFRPYYTDSGKTTLSPTAPGTPTTGSTSPTSNTTPTWNWNPSIDANHYIFYWSTILGGTDFDSGNISGTSYTHTDPLGDFIWYTKVIAYDPDNNSSPFSNNSSPLTVDKSNPSLSSVQISSDNSANDLAKVGDLVTLTFTSNESLQGTPSVAIAGHSVTPTNTSGNIWLVNYQMISGDSEGTVPFTISNYSDLAGNNGSTVSTTTDASSITFDKTAPTYIWNSPAVDSAYSDSQPISVEASITETGSGIVDGANCNPAIHVPAGSFTGTVTYSSATGKCAGTITLNNPSNLGDGTHHITLSVTDRAGNSVITTDRNIQIDNTAPTVVLTDDHADSIVRDADTVVITATFTEADQIDEVTPPKLSIHSSDLVNNASMTKVSNLVWTYTWNVPSGNNGSHTVSILAHDRAGKANTGATGKISYTIDNTAPTITVDPYDTTPTNLDITVTASTNEGTLNTTSHLFTANGSFDFVATDAAGNSTTQTVTISNIDKTAPTVTPTLVDGDSDYSLPDLGDGRFGVTLIFSEELSTSSKTDVKNALNAGADKLLTFKWGSGDISNKLRISVTGSETATFANDVVVNISDVAGNTTNSALLVDSKLDATQVAPVTGEDGNGTATANAETPEVVITNPDQEVTVTVTGSTEATIDVSSFITEGEGDIPQINIDSDVAEIEIPATGVKGPDTWDGIIQAPISGTPSGGNAPAGFSVGSVVISVGSPDGTLVFDDPVTIILSGVTGTVGYRPSGSDTWQTITNVCGGSYATPTSPTAPGECYISDGTNTKIYTYHFTSFASLNTVSSADNSSVGINGGGDGLGCANHDCSVHPATGLLAQAQTQVSDFVGGFVEGVLGTATDETVVSPESSLSADPESATFTPTPTGEVKGIETGGTNYWWLLFFGAGVLGIIYWFLKRKPV